MLCPRSFRFESLKWVMEADSAELGKSECLETGVEPEKRETEHGCLFPVADGGGYVITMPCVWMMKCL